MCRPHNLLPHLSELQMLATRKRAARCEFPITRKARAGFPWVVAIGSADVAPVSGRGVGSRRRRSITGVGKVTTPPSLGTVPLRKGTGFQRRRRPLVRIGRIGPKRTLCAQVKQVRLLKLGRGGMVRLGRSKSERRSGGGIAGIGGLEAPRSAPHLLNVEVSPFVVTDLDERQAIAGRLGRESPMLVATWRRAGSGIPLSPPSLL